MAFSSLLLLALLALLAIPLGWMLGSRLNDLLESW